MIALFLIHFRQKLLVVMVGEAEVSSPVEKEIAAGGRSFIHFIKQQRGKIVKGTPFHGLFFFFKLPLLIGLD